MCKHHPDRVESDAKEMVCKEHGRLSNTGQKRNRTIDAFTPTFEILDASCSECGQVIICERTVNHQYFSQVILDYELSALQRSYKATLRILIAEARDFLRQCQLFSNLRIFDQSLQSSTCSSKEHSKTTSFKATVIPPPVRGCRIFHASPMRMTPALDTEEPCKTGGRKEHGMRRMRSLSNAFCTAAWYDVGI